MKTQLLSLLLVMGVCQQVFAAVPVEDIQHRSSQPENRAPAATATSVPDLEPLPEPEQPVATDSYSQLQLLREEVMQLRGMVEQLSNEVQQLKQRQADDYMDLDRRLSRSSAASPAASTKPAEKSLTASVNGGGSDEVQSYSNAYNLLKEGKIDQAISAFKGHIKAYPSGSYVPNCHYWLGEVYLLKSNLENARQSFTTVVESHGDHRKAADATFKLGKVYHLLGNQVKAKALLTKAADGDTAAARKAKQYLSDNF